MGSTRTRAWRRAQRDRHINQRRDRFIADYWGLPGQPTKPGHLAKSKGIPPHGASSLPRLPKAWNQLWRRANKLARARQLKLFYPRRHWIAAIDDERSLYL